MGAGPFPGVVLLHHMPGWDDWYKEAARTFAHRGYLAVAPDLYCRAGHGTPDEVAAIVRAEGGVPDDQVVADAEAAAKLLRSSPLSNGRVGVFGSCSGGRHAYLAACRSDAFDAVVDLWGGGVVMAEQDLTDKKPVAPIDYTRDLNCPLLGLFGAEDRSPPVEQVAIHEAELQTIGQAVRVSHLSRCGARVLLSSAPCHVSGRTSGRWVEQGLRVLRGPPRITELRSKER